MNEIYSNVISNVKIMEKKLLNTEQYNRMIEATSPDEAIKIIAQNGYDVNNLERAEDYEIILNKSLKEVFKELYSIAPDINVIDIMSLKYDFNNLKLILKNKIVKTKDLEKLFIKYSNSNVDETNKAIETGIIKDLKPNIKEILSKILKDFNNEMDPQILDMQLDTDMYEEMNRILSLINNDFITNFIKQTIDVQNFKTFVRSKSMGKSNQFLKKALQKGGKIDIDTYIKSYDGSKDFADFISSLPQKFNYKDISKIVSKVADDYATNGSLANMEKIFDNYLIEIIKNSKYTFFGPDAIVSYIFAKEVEIRNIRTLMVGKISGVSPNDLKERLRDTYV